MSTERYMTNNFPGNPINVLPCADLLPDLHMKVLLSTNQIPLKGKKKKRSLIASERRSAGGLLQPPALSDRVWAAVTSRPDLFG